MPAPLIFCIMDAGKVLCGHHSFFACFGNTEFDNRLCRNVDLLARCRVASHACITVNQYELTDTRECEPVFRFNVRKLSQFFHKIGNLRFCKSCTLCQMCHGL